MKSKSLIKITIITNKILILMLMIKLQEYRLMKNHRVAKCHKSIKIMNLISKEKQQD